MAKTTRKKSAKTKKPATAMSLHLGLNAVDPKHYAGWDGQLTACEFDAKDMAAISRSRRMHSTTLLTAKATRAAALAAIRAAAKKLGSGDFFFLTYSGHGGQMPDVTGEEKDKKDETWCLYDGELIDDELYLELTRFAAGVRVLVLSDSCHSGTVTRAVPRDGGRSKMMPPAIAMRTYDEHQAFYDQLQKAVAAASTNGKRNVDPDAAIANAHATVSLRLTEIAKRCKAAVILISGCQDNQTSMDGDHNGAFTEQLLQVWDHGRYAGTYAQFHGAIKSHMPSSQTPNLFTLGPAAAFAKQQPFSV
jgi:metacaspase-1